jgi:hypothetical protein
MKTSHKIALAVTLLLAFVASFFFGRHTAKPTVVWLSDLNVALGRSGYLLDVDVACANGKKLGKLQVDLNLTNGKLRVVRNDPGTEPSCK